MDEAKVSLDQHSQTSALLSCNPYFQFGFYPPRLYVYMNITFIHIYMYKRLHTGTPAYRCMYSQRIDTVSGFIFFVAKMICLRFCSYQFISFFIFLLKLYGFHRVGLIQFTHSRLKDIGSLLLILWFVCVCFCYYKMYCLGYPVCVCVYLCVCAVGMSQVFFQSVLLGFFSFLYSFKLFSFS